MLFNSFTILKIMYYKSSQISFEMLRFKYRWTNIGALQLYVRLILLIKFAAFIKATNIREYTVHSTTHPYNKIILIVTV